MAKKSVTCSRIYYASYVHLLHETQTLEDSCVHYFDCQSVKFYSAQKWIQELSLCLHQYQSAIT